MEEISVTMTRDKWELICSMAGLGYDVKNRTDTFNESVLNSLYGNNTEERNVMFNALDGLCSQIEDDVLHYIQ